MNKVKKARLKLELKLSQHEDEIPCYHEDPNLFDPEMFDDFHTRQNAIKDAKALCGGCPAKQECFDYGLKLHPTAMIWGGATATELDRIRYPRKI